jgi:hypothetical protein
MRLLFFLGVVWGVNIFCMDGANEAQMKELCTAICSNNSSAVERIVVDYPTIINTYHEHDQSCTIFDQKCGKFVSCYYSNNKMMPLHIAVAADSYECAKILLQKKADPNAKTMSFSDLHAAPLHFVQSPTMVHLLKIYDARMDEETMISRRTPLYDVLFFRATPDFIIARALIEYGVDVDQENGSYTLLTKAILRPDFLIGRVKFLLTQGANRTKTDGLGKTSLQTAQQKHPGFQELMNLLQ